MRGEHPMRGDQRSTSLHVPARLQGLTLDRVSPRMRERQRMSSAPCVLVIVQMREPVQVRRERGVPSHPPSGEVHLSKSNTPPLYP